MNKEINDKLKELGISIQADFIPTKYDKVKDARLNWYVTLLADDKPVLSTEYHAGIGHIKGYKNSLNGGMCVDDAHSILAICAGKPAHRNFKFKRPELDPKDVIYCLVNDADAINHSTFEEWAGNVGEDSDSRRAERIYRDCLEIGLKMRAGLGDKQLEILRELVQDY